MYKTLNIILIVLLIALVSGCATKRQTGAATGAAAGTALGAAVGGDAEGAVIGGLLGTIVGHEVGRYMDQQDRERTREVLENTPSGQTSDWVNPDTGYEYQVTPSEPFEIAGTEPCREFDIVTEDNGVEYRSTEVACRRPDGVWEIRG